MSSKAIGHTTEKALAYLRGLPRVSLLNTRNNPGATKGVSFPIATQNVTFKNIRISKSC